MMIETRVSLKHELSKSPTQTSFSARKRRACGMAMVEGMEKGLGWNSDHGLLKGLSLILGLGFEK